MNAHLVYSKNSCAGNPSCASRETTSSRLLNEAARICGETLTAIREFMRAAGGQNEEIRIADMYQVRFGDRNTLHSMGHAYIENEASLALIKQQQRIIM